MARHVWLVTVDYGPCDGGALILGVYFAQHRALAHVIDSDCNAEDVEIRRYEDGEHARGVGVPVEGKLVARWARVPGSERWGWLVTDMGALL